MPDEIRALQDELRSFAAARGWERYHTPQNLAALIASEAGELLALFRWGQDSVTERPVDVAHELADVFLGVLRFADVAGIDLPGASRAKLTINGELYPAHPAIGPDRERDSRL
jgi:NTP pyrophosphatase (non-canonical NTP hydrolase)